MLSYLIIFENDSIPNVFWQDGDRLFKPFKSCRLIVIYSSTLDELIDYSRKYGHTYMDNHHTIWSHTHQVQHLALVCQLSACRFYDCWLWTTKLGVLTRMCGQSVAVVSCKCSGFCEQLGGIIKGITKFFV